MTSQYTAQGLYIGYALGSLAHSIPVVCIYCLFKLTPDIARFNADTGAPINVVQIYSCPSGLSQANKMDIAQWLYIFLRPLSIPHKTK